MGGFSRVSDDSVPGRISEADVRPFSTSTPMISLSQKILSQKSQEVRPSNVVYTHVVPEVGLVVLMFRVTGAKMWLTGGRVPYTHLDSHSHRPYFAAALPPLLLLCFRALLPGGTNLESESTSRIVVVLASLARGGGGLSSCGPRAFRHPNLDYMPPGLSAHSSVQ